MRISDWSSDVCSSDLLRLHISLVAIDIQHHRPRLDLSFEPLEGRLCRGGRIFVPASTVLPRHETVPRCINRHFGCRKPASCRIAQRQNERFPGPASLRIETATDTMRSEEHTSELQSLMRISYAVFCLNKKTKQ